MRPLQLALRLADRNTIVGFYSALGYQLVGEVHDSPRGHLTMLRLDDEFVSLKPVRDPPVAVARSSAAAISLFWQRVVPFVAD
jgi:lactoylglutathione lyase